jgi:hypothetical protein
MQQDPFCRIKQCVCRSGGCSRVLREAHAGSICLAIARTVSAPNCPGRVGTSPAAVIEATSGWTAFATTRNPGQEIAVGFGNSLRDHRVHATGPLLRLGPDRYNIKLLVLHLFDQRSGDREEFQIDLGLFIGVEHRCFR